MVQGQLGPYSVDAEIGAGGMGKVYAATVSARTPGLAEGDRVAIKVVHRHLLDTPGFFKRFLREADIGKSVVHPNVVRTYDCDAMLHDGVQLNFLVMELVEGQTLRALGEELDRVPEELCRHIGTEIAKGLSAIHAAGVVHRDMKPENVLITPGQVVKIMDLGVARLADEALRLSQTGMFVGSVHYAAPEQFAGGGDTLDPRTDLHAVGLILYELSCGLAPYEAASVPEVLKNVLHTEPRRLGDINPQLSPFFEEVVHTLLAKKPDERFASAEDLEHVLGEGESSAWWKERATALQKETHRPLRRIRVPRETALYGRDAELAKLRTRYEKARSGDGQVLLLEGEAGIGKTRLVDEFIDRLLREGEDLQFLFGGYPPGGAATASGGFSTAYREHLGAAGLDTALEHYLAPSPALIPAFAALLRGEPTPAGATPLNKDAIFTCFVHTTRALAEDRTTVVLIDDLHFAPSEGRALFVALALAVPGHRILLVGTSRQGEEDWMTEIERLGYGTRVALSRLGPKDLVHMLADSFRSSRLADRVAAQIAVKSDGNPYFVFEIVRGLRESNAITKSEDGTWITTGVIEEIRIPSSITDLVEARLAELGEEDREMLDVAACCGFEFDGTLVAEVLGLKRIPAFRRLGRLEKRLRLIRSVGRNFVFDHHQVRDALYEGLSEVLREEYHAALGEALEERMGCAEGDTDGMGGAVAVELCEHFLNGGRGERALRYLGAALGHLDAGYLNDHCIRLTARFLGREGLVTGERRIKLLLRQVSLVGLLGRRDEQRALIDEAVALAEETSDDRLMCQAKHRLATHYRNTGQLTEGQTAALEAREVARGLEDEALEREVEGTLAQILMFSGRLDEARDLCERRIEFGTRTGDAHLVRVAEGTLGILCIYQGRLNDATVLYKRVIESARDSGDPLSEVPATINLGNAHVAMGRTADQIDCQLRALDLARQCGFRRGEAIAHVNLGSAYTAVGDIDRATEHLDACFALCRETRVPRPATYALIELGTCAEQRGDFDLAEKRLRAALEQRREIGYVTGLPPALLTLGAFLLAQGRSDDARPFIEEGLERAREMEIPGSIVFAEAALALLLGGDAKRALAELERLEGRMRQDDAFVCRRMLWKATGDEAHLAEAWRLLRERRDNAPEEYRESMLVDVPRYAEIVAAVRAAGLDADKE